MRQSTAKQTVRSTPPVNWLDLEDPIHELTALSHLLTLALEHDARMGVNTDDSILAGIISLHFSTSNRLKKTFYAACETLNKPQEKV